MRAIKTFDIETSTYKYECTQRDNIVVHTERSQSLVFKNCSDCTVTIRGKFKSLKTDQIQRCSFVIDECSDLFFGSSKNVKIRIVKSVQLLNFENSTDFAVSATEQCIQEAEFVLKSCERIKIHQADSKRKHELAKTKQHSLSKIVDGKVFTQYIDI